jgi:nucleoside-diphosphate-sugar epimerase
VLGDTGPDPADEDAATDHPAAVVEWRPSHERQVLQSADETLQTSVVRPGMVYGGRGGLVSRLFETASGSGAAEHVGDGGNRWSLVHRDDLGRLYVTIAEGREGGVFHGVDGTPVRVSEAARAASEAAGADGRTRAVPLEEAQGSMGPMADALVLDQALAGRRSGEIGWAPERASFVEAAESAWREWEEVRTPA